MNKKLKIHLITLREVIIVLITIPLTIALLFASVFWIVYILSFVVGNMAVCLPFILGLCGLVIFIDLYVHFYMEVEEDQKLKDKEK